VPRPLEYGPTGKADAPAGQTVDRFDVIAFDMAARDFLSWPRDGLVRPR
jgi:hypothetical protein